MAILTQNPMKHRALRAGTSNYWEFDGAAFVNLTGTAPLTLQGTAATADADPQGRDWVGPVGELAPGAYLDAGDLNLGREFFIMGRFGVKADPAQSVTAQRSVFHITLGDYVLLSEVYCRRGTGGQASVYLSVEEQVSWDYYAYQDEVLHPVVLATDDAGLEARQILYLAIYMRDGALSMTCVVPGGPISRLSLPIPDGLDAVLHSLGGQGLLKSVDTGGEYSDYSDMLFTINQLLMLPHGGSEEQFLHWVDLLENGRYSSGLLMPVNNSEGTVEAALSAADTVLAVVGGTAAFAAPGPQEVGRVTLMAPYDPGLFEICALVGNDGLSLELLRGQEGTTALDWPVGTQVRGLLTGGLLELAAPTEITPYGDIPGAGPGGTGTVYGEDASAPVGSMAIGKGTTVSADSVKSTALGEGANAYGATNCLVAGGGAGASGENTTVLGVSASSGSASRSVVVGAAANVSGGEDSISIGASANAGSAQRSIVVGAAANAGSAADGVTIGDNASAGSSQRSVALGAMATVGSARDSVALGYGTKANSAYRTVAVGATTDASSAYDTVAIGYGMTANSASYSVVLGQGALASSSARTVAIGASVAASNGNDSVGVGCEASVSGAWYSVALGQGSTAAAAWYSVALGQGSTAAAAWYSVALGQGANVGSAWRTVAIGRAVTAGSAYDSVILGDSATAGSATRSVAVGAGSAAGSTTDSVSLGAFNVSVGGARKILLGAGLEVDGNDTIVIGSKRKLTNGYSQALAVGAPAALPGPSADVGIDAAVPAICRFVTLENYIFSATTDLAVGDIVLTMPTGMLLIPSEVGIMALSGIGDIDGALVTLTGDDVGAPLATDAALTGTLASAKKFRLPGVPDDRGHAQFTFAVTTAPPMGGGVFRFYVKGLLLQS